MSAGRLAVLLLIQGTRPQATEDELLRADIEDYRLAPSTAPGANSTNVARLKTGRRCYHKPYSGLNRALAKQYGHDWATVTASECAAWRVARALGHPYTELVGPTVLRFHEAGVSDKAQAPTIKDGWGSCCIEHAGHSLDPAPLSIADLVDAAAFFDALIAQQDRHIGQYRWDPSTGRLGLIDHGFCFAMRGDICNESLFVDTRLREGRGSLSPDERAVLTKLKGSRFLQFLRGIVGDDRAAAFEDRVDWMLGNGTIPPKGAW